MDKLSLGSRIGQKLGLFRLKTHGLGEGQRPHLMSKSTHLHVCLCICNMRVPQYKTSFCIYIRGICESR